MNEKDVAYISEQFGIEKEIAARYYFESGKIQIGLRNDSEVREAIALINNPAKYDKLLSK